MHEAPAVVLSGGGTGGHLYPALAIAEALRRRRPDVRLVFLGARRGLEARILPERREEHVLLPVEGLQRGRTLASWKAGPALLVSLVRAVGVLRRVRAQAVVVTGGYAGAPAGLAAGLTRAPLVLQEQNVRAGVTVRLLSRWARWIFVGFPEAIDSLPPSARVRARFTGNPVRAVPPLSRPEARRRLGLPVGAPLLLVVGGSQGALALNRALTDVVMEVVRGTLARAHGVHVLWSTGPKHHEAVLERLAAAGSPDWVHARAYIEDMPAALAATDLAVSRAGAIATAELLNQGVPSILVPLPTAAADHQSKNARALEAAGAALVHPEADLAPASLWAAAIELLGDRERLAGMARAARSRARPDAADEIAAAVEALLPAREAGA